LNKGPATLLRLGRCRAATSRALTRRPRPVTGRGSLFPMHCALRPLESSRSHAPRTAPYQQGARRGPPVRRRCPAVRTPVEAGYHGRISAVTLPSPRPSRPYKCRAFSPPHAGIAAPPHHPRRRRRAAPPASHGRATAHGPFLDPIGPSRATCCPGRALVVAGAEPPWLPPPVLTVRPRRRVPHPNSGHPQALGEHMVVPHRFPGRERGQLAGIRSAPPPPHA
jgi:hypothetical protein